MTGNRKCSAMTTYPASTARQILCQYRYGEKTPFLTSLNKIKIFLNYLDQNFTLILLVSFLSGFTKIKVPQSRAEMGES